MKGSLYVRLESRRGETFIADVSCAAPLKLAKPFRLNGMTELMIMSATPGLMDGDEFRVRVDVGEGCRVRVTSQSYTKLYRSVGLGGARQTVEFSVADGAELRWEPLPTMPFAGSVASFETIAEVAPSGRLLLADTLGCGRAAMGERFAFERYESCTSVRVAGKLVYHDVCRLIPSEHDTCGLGFFEGFDWQHSGYSYGLEPPDNMDTPERVAASSEARMGHSFVSLSRFALR
ncbi:MAG: urease accessory protein UreD [Oscillospiraceae bacterium]|jgi:urease accessory protein|nr:urease accessory protein UreD [Oscillospiraceae bacterium]